MNNSKSDVSTEVSILESLRESGVTADLYSMGKVCALGQVGELEDINSKAIEAFPGMGVEEREQATIANLSEAAQVLMKDPNIQPPLVSNSQIPPEGQLLFRLLNNEDIDLSGLPDKQRASVEIISGYMKVGKETGACIIRNMGGGDIDPIQYNEGEGGMFRLYEELLQGDEINFDKSSSGASSQVFGSEILQPLGIEAINTDTWESKLGALFEHHVDNTSGLDVAVPGEVSGMQVKAPDDVIDQTVLIGMSR